MLLSTVVYFVVALALKIPQACKILEWMHGRKAQ